MLRSGPALALLLASGVLSTVGCGAGGVKSPVLTEAEVFVTINGVALPSALVTLTPSVAGYGASSIATGVTDASGKATLTCGGKSGACVGENKVTVIEAPAPVETRGEDGDAQNRAGQYARSLKNRPIPGKYSSLAGSDLALQIKAGQKDYKLDLKR